MDTYEELLDRASRLDKDAQLRLLEGLAGLVRRQIEEEPLHDITELRGLGSEVWRDPETGELIDA